MSHCLSFFDVDGQVLDEVLFAQSEPLPHLVDVVPLLHAHAHHVEGHVQVNVGVVRVRAPFTVGVSVWVGGLRGRRLRRALAAAVVEADGRLGGLALLLVLFGLGRLVGLAAKLLLYLDGLEETLLSNCKKNRSS